VRGDASSGAGRPVLITGGAGFIGANLADRLARDGHKVIVYDALMRPGVETNLDWLRRRHGERIIPVIADVCDGPELLRAVTEAAVVFHLAAQVAVTTSLADPIEDFRINLHGTLLLLEAIRCCRPGVPLIFASTNKVYGALGDLALRVQGDRYVPEKESVREHGIGEDRPLEFHTPYGCSKGAADQYVLDYARSFGVPAAVFRMSCIYGPRQMGTEDQGWVAHFLLRALRREPIVVFGDGRQVRDLLFVDDAVAAYVAAWRSIGRLGGRVFNLGGGPRNAVSLLEVLHRIRMLLGTPVEVRHDDWRAGDQRYYVSDTRAATLAMALPEPTPWHEGLAALAEWLRGRQPKFHAATLAASRAEAVP
jgi:CDP-paratose 2-epimerase